jgi:hypothetical protein
MKSSQWIIALVVLSAMVFGITFLLNYSPDTTGTKDNGETPATAPWVNVTDPVYPAPLKDDAGPEKREAPPAEQEHGQMGYHDYWFINDGEQPVKTGLISTSCTCASLEVFVMPPQWKQRWSSLHPEVKVVTPAESDDKELKAIEKEVTALKFDENNDITIEPGTVGKFRMHWKGNRLGAQRIRATLWAGQRGANQQTLQAHLLFLDPLRSSVEDRDRIIGLLHRSQLPLDLDCKVWSSTRDELEFKSVKLANKPGALGPDPVIVGKPVALTAEKCKELEENHIAGLKANNRRSDLEGRVRCAYSIPIRIQSDSIDGGTPLEIGSFRRRIEIVPADETISPLFLTISGTIRGVVEVDDGGRIDFGSVKRSTGAEKGISLHTEEAGLQLEVDESRLPHFLKAELSKPDVKKTGTGESRAWRLHVEILPNRVSGTFPRDDDLPAYDDCAVYLKIRRPDPRPKKGTEYLRVPVKGVVTDS